MLGATSKAGRRCDEGWDGPYILLGPPVRNHAVVPVPTSSGRRRPGSRTSPPRLHDTRASGRSRDSFSCNGLFLALRMPPERMSHVLHCLRNPIANDERGSQFQSGMNLICMLLVVPFPQIRFAYWYSSVFLAGMTSATLFRYFFLKKAGRSRHPDPDNRNSHIYYDSTFDRVTFSASIENTKLIKLNGIVSIIYGLALNIYILGRD
jgi:hypothetical protein